MTTREQAEAILMVAYLSTMNLGRMAEALNVSTAQLRRRLLAEGTNYTALLEAERRRRCDQLLQEHGRRCYGKIVAAELGYVELNSFYRAFKAWHGTGFTGARIGF